MTLPAQSAPHAPVSHTNGETHGGARWRVWGALSLSPFLLSGSLYVSTPCQSANRCERAEILTDRRGIVVLSPPDLLLLMLYVAGWQWHFNTYIAHAVETHTRSEKLPYTGRWSAERRIRHVTRYHHRPPECRRREARPGPRRRVRKYRGRISRVREALSGPRVYPPGTLSTSYTKIPGWVKLEGVGQFIMSMGYST